MGLADTWMLVLALVPQATPTQVLHVGDAVGSGQPRLRQPSRLLAAGVQRQLRVSVADALPTGWRLGGVQLREAHPALHGEGVQLQANLMGPPVAGRNLVRLQVWRDGDAQAPAYAWAQLTPSFAAARTEPVIKRGQEVVVVVRTGNVTVQTKGVAQQAASLGEPVAVLPHSCTHTVQAVVQDDATVEIRL